MGRRITKDDEDEGVYEREERGRDKKQKAVRLETRSSLSVLSLCVAKEYDARHPYSFISLFANFIRFCLIS